MSDCNCAYACELPGDYCRCEQREIVRPLHITRMEMRGFPRLLHLTVLRYHGVVARPNVILHAFNT